MFCLQVSLDAADVAIAAADKSALGEFLFIYIWAISMTACLIKGHCDVWVSSAALEAKLLSAKDATCTERRISVKNNSSVVETAECVVTVKP